MTIDGMKVLIEEYLNKNDYKYESTDKGFTFGLGLPGRINKVRIVIRVYNDGVQFATYLEGYSPDKGKEWSVSEYLHRVNSGLIRGGFEYWIDDDVILFRNFMNNSKEIFDEFFEVNLFLGSKTIVRYGDALLEVMFGMTSPKDAINKVEGPSKPDI